MADTFWMTAKRDGHCAECEDDIEVGDRIVWDSRAGKAYCAACGEDMVELPGLDDEVEM